MLSLTCECVWSDVSSEPPTGANSTVSPSAVHVKENGADLRCILLKLPGIRSLLAKTADFVHTYISLQNTVQLRLHIFQSTTLSFGAALTAYCQKISGFNFFVHEITN